MRTCDSCGYGTRGNRLDLWQAPKG
jgi:ribosomal protein L37E